MIFKLAEKYNFEEIIYCNDDESGLNAIIVIHDTTFGPGGGGTRMMDYESEEAALTDALRLAQGMTRKCALSQSGIGGAKAVIMCKPEDKTDEMLKAYGRFVEKLNGQFLTGNDVNIGVDEARVIASETQYVLGVSERLGSSSPVTSHGVFSGMKACVKAAFNKTDFSGLTVAIQGLGAVGFALAKELHQNGAKLIVTDINQEAVLRAVDEFGATAVKNEEIYAADADIFAPCALGAILNPKTIPQLRAKVICGAANNQLLSYEDGDALYQRGILYAPDYVVNAGGAIYVRVERTQPNATAKDLIRETKIIEHTMEEIIQLSIETKTPHHIIADRLADEKIAQEKRRKRS